MSNFKVLLLDPTFAPVMYRNISNTPLGKTTTQKSMTMWN